MIPIDLYAAYVLAVVVLMVIPGPNVALIVANSDKRDKFVKVARLMRPEKGSVYVSEFWTREPLKDYQFRWQPTEVRALASLIGTAGLRDGDTRWRS